MMKIDILFFGVTVDLAEVSKAEMELKNSSTVADFKTVLVENYPNLKNITSFAVAVNETYADDVFLLKENDVVAIIPPVSGG